MTQGYGATLTIRCPSTSYGVRMHGWRDTPLVAYTILSIFLIAMLTIPVVRLGADGPSRFSWQMFSKSSTTTEFKVQTATGTESVIIADFMARPRTDLPLEDIVPPHVCESIPGAISVSWSGGNYTC